jgi:hypothetical protein
MTGYLSHTKTESFCQAFQDLARCLVVGMLSFNLNAKSFRERCLRAT